MWSLASALLLYAVVREWWLDERGVRMSADDEGWSEFRSKRRQQHVAAGVMVHFWVQGGAGIFLDFWREDNMIWRERSNVAKRVRTRKSCAVVGNDTHASEQTKVDK